MDLLGRSFFQEVEMDALGNISECKMHDLMHDLAISVAESLISTLNDKKRNVEEKVRHVSFVGDCDANFSSISTSLCKASRIRTFFLLGDPHVRVGNIDCETIFSSFKWLRIVWVMHQGINISSIEKLKHLRYFDLFGNRDIEQLPKSIIKLQN